VHGESGFEFKVADQETIATWAFKTALMVDFALPKKKPIPVSTYSNLFATRRPPSGAAVWTGAYVPERRAGQARRGIVEAAISSKGVESKSTAYFHVATFTAFRVIFQVLTPFPEQEGAPTVNRESEPRLASIWPASRSIRWPPNDPGFPQGQFDQLSMRTNYFGQA
jgi:hypothetical protein